MKKHAKKADVPTPKNQNFPHGWDEERVQRVLAHYENQTEDEAVAEDDMGAELTGASLRGAATLRGAGLRAAAFFGAAFFFAAIFFAGFLALAFAAFFPDSNQRQP